MQTLELFTPPSHPDGWRQVLAPGGYECWRFETRDERVEVVVGLWLGHPDDARYARAVRQYLKRPTRTVPPVPSQFPSITVEYRADGATAERIFTCENADSFRAAPDGVDIALGDATLKLHDGGDYLLQMNLIDAGFYAGLTFVGVGLSKSTDDPPHHAVVLLEDAKVEGELRLGARGRGRDIDFRGRGSHSHRFGMRPPLPGQR